ncbi:sensor histidine kinase [Salisaeta longa]|uniref:sensor histidine kinase n=1 Tax=Salisaeta longa TaxID=503170 RepID=UPI0003FE4292|nr:PAS domain-containing sensor histidine kinase [Salisaeta longa]
MLHSPHRTAKSTPAAWSAPTEQPAPDRPTAQPSAQNAGASRTAWHRLARVVHQLAGAPTGVFAPAATQRSLVAYAGPTSERDALAAWAASRLLPTDHILHEADDALNGAVYSRPIRTAAGVRWLCVLADAPLPAPLRTQIDDVIALMDSPAPDASADEPGMPLLSALPIAVYRSTPSGRLLYANEALLTLLGYPPDTPLASIDLEARDFADVERNAFKEAIEANDRIVNRNATLACADGSTVEVLESAHAVRDAHGHIQYYEGLIEDVTARRAYERELEQAKVRAEELSRLKSTFLANMSHEIRTPLTSIVGFADVLREEVDGSAGEMADLIQKSAHRLKDTLTSVLELARLEGKNEALDATSFDAVTQVQESAELMRPMAESKGLRFDVDVPDHPVEVRHDARALHRILTNLTSNAIKYTERGSVTIRLAAHDAGVTFEVADTGPGIAPAHQHQVFDAFERVAAQSYQEGTGLGLSITKRLIELMGGTVQLNSTEGEGSTFAVTLPYTLPAPDSA